MPLVLQYNKQDLPDIVGEDDLNRALNPWGRRTFTAIAAAGQCVMETFVAVVQEMLTASALKYNLEEKGLDPAAVPAIVSQAFAEVMSGGAHLRAEDIPPPAADGFDIPGDALEFIGDSAAEALVAEAPAARLVLSQFTDSLHAAPPLATPGGGAGVGRAAAPVDPVQRRAGGGPGRAGAGHEPRAGGDPLPRGAAAPL